jgi:hypothetical protein
VIVFVAAYCLVLLAFAQAPGSASHSVNEADGVGVSLKGRKEATRRAVRISHKRQPLSKWRTGSVWFSGGEKWNQMSLLFSRLPKVPAGGEL